MHRRAQFGSFKSANWCFTIPANDSEEFKFANDLKCENDPSLVYTCVRVQVYMFVSVCMCVCACVCVRLCTCASQS